MKTRREKMLSTPVQFTDKQYLNSEEIMKNEGIKYFSEYVRTAVDFYTEQKYPHLAK